MGEQTLIVAIQLLPFLKGSEEMTRQEFDKLKRGDIVRHVGVPDSYVIESTYLKYHIGVRTIMITNPQEWIKVGFLKGGEKG